MIVSTPIVSVGLPVYNGADFVRESIESILGQTLLELELIITDNASTDKTSEICQEFVAKDKRVKYRRSPENRGAAWNFNEAFRLATGKYFKWQAHDDRCAPEFLEKCVEVLDNQPDVLLAYPQTVDIDAKGQVTKEWQLDLHEQSTLPCERFHHFIRVDHHCLPIFGVIRSEVLRQTGLIRSFVGSDRILLAELALKGRLYEVPARLFYHRQHSGRSTQALHIAQQRSGWFDTKYTGKRVLPNWRKMYEFTRAVIASDLNIKQKAKCLYEVYGWAKGSWRRFPRDIKYFVGSFFTRDKYGGPKAV